jgi:hypothetical protein
MVGHLGSPSLSFQVNGRLLARGLETKTFMDNSCPTIARIPSEWRLVVDVNEDFFHRMDVVRTTELGAIKQAILDER